MSDHIDWTQPLGSRLPQRIYISGPMTGHPGHNYPAFHRMAQKFRAAGFHVENPAENPGFDSWEGYMRHALAKLLTCDAILMLDGWENSRGAKIERNLALELGMRELTETYRHPAVPEAA